jgi:hypothetical protein
VSTLSDQPLSMSPQAQAERVGDRIVVLDLVSEQYLELDPVGSMIWDELANGSSPAAVVELLLTRFTVERDRVTSDVEAFVRRLHSLGLAA